MVEPKSSHVSICYTVHWPLCIVKGRNPSNTPAPVRYEEDDAILHGGAHVSCDMQSRRADDPSAGRTSAFLCAHDREHL